MYQQVATLGRPTPQAISLLERSSPSSVAGRIDVPTLLVQGETDSLFGLDQANGNYQAIRRNGAPVDLVWFAGGHDGGNQETSRISQLTAQWFERWLKPRHLLYRPGEGTPGSGVPATGQPAFAVSRDLGFDPSSGTEMLDVATAPRYPGLAGTRRTTVRLGGRAQVIINPPGGAPPSMSALPGLATGIGVFPMPGQSAAFTSAPLAAPLQQTGSATVRVRVSGAPAVTVFAAVYDVDQAGHATLPFGLAAPVRVTSTAPTRAAPTRAAPTRAASTSPATSRTVTVTLPAMDYQFAAGHRLRLVLTSTDFGYATPRAVAAYRVALAGPGLSVPADPALQIAGGGVPWWTWAAPIAALAAAAVILLARRRSAGLTRSRSEAAGDPRVPLEIMGLTKRYRDGQLAVDGLSLRVERGQILGLLGPNGAGKTTTLRALMGLVYPDAGTITIFGQQVRPGAPALSRLGSFVEGPGFLPAPVRPGQPGPVLAGDRPPPGRRALRRGPADRRAGRRSRPPGAVLLAGDEPAAGHRPGHARAARSAGPRRADERPGPAADQGDARCPAPVRGRGPDCDLVQSPARRGGADLHPPGRHAPGARPARPAR